MRLGRNVALRFGSKVLIGTVRGNSHWRANVVATPAAAIWMGGSRRSGRVTIHHEGLIDVASIEVEPFGDTSSERVVASAGPVHE